MEKKGIIEILKMICFVMVIMLGGFILSFAAQKNEQISLSNNLLRKQNELKAKEILLQEKKIRNEEIRQDIENIRLSGFLKAYKEKEFIVEVIK